MLKILFLVSSLNTGDVSQVEAITKAFANQNLKIEKSIIDAKQDFISAKNQYLTEIKNIPDSEKYITLAVGEEGMKLLNYISDNNFIDYKRSYTCLSIHQYFSNIKDLKLDHIIIPESTIDTAEEKEAINEIPKITYIFAPIGDNPSKDELKDSYLNWLNRPEIEKKYIIVMLPGDAPDGLNNIKYFTKDSAFKLFQCIHNLWQEKGKQHKIIVENGPRTGKYDPETGKVISTHEYKINENPQNAVDYISKYFIELLEKNNLSYSFYNFVIEVDGSKRKTISYFKPLLYLAEQNDNLFILPGASVSLMGQIPLYLTSDKTILFKPSSMNEDHENVANLAFARNYFAYFNENCEVIEPKEVTKKFDDDSSLMVKEIYQGFSNAFDE